MQYHPWSTEIDKFLAMALASGLLNSEQLANAWDDFRRDLSRDELTVAAFCSYLISHQLLSQWQCNKLQEGKHKGFFLDGRFKLIESIGITETYGRYLAEDTQTSRQVEVQVLPPAIKKSYGWQQSYDGIRYRIVDR